MRPPCLLASKEDRPVYVDSQGSGGTHKLKDLLMKALILTPLAEKELLLLYVTATTSVVSATLVIEQEEEGHTLKVQCPVYFISKVFSNTKTHYPQIWKL
jgi:hypothetical protein